MTRPPIDNTWLGEDDAREPERAIAGIAALAWLAGGATVVVGLVWLAVAWGL